MEGGGIALYSWKELAVKHCLELEPVRNLPFESLWARIYIPQGTILLGVFYCPPNMPATDADHFISYLDITMSAVSKMNYQGLILTGDFNAKSKHWLVPSSGKQCIRHSSI
jgi:hypothetical protein